MENLNNLKKRVLVLSGGGNRGAYEVGVLKHLILDKGIRYDAIIGVSAGALNASYITRYNKNEQDKAIKDLENLWKSKELKIQKPWFKSYFLSFWAAIFGIRPSFLNSEPLKNIIENEFKDKRHSDVNLYVGVTELNNGKFEIIDCCNEDIKKYVLASASIPMIFPPIQINNTQYVDGGIRENTPVKDIVLSNEFNEIDVIILVPKTQDLAFKKKNFKNIFSIGYRTINILMHKILTSEVNMLNTEHIIDCLQQDKEINPDISINVFAPKTNLLSLRKIYSILSTNKKLINHYMQMGYNDAQEHFNSSI